MPTYLLYAKLLFVPSPTSCDTSWLCDLGLATCFQILGMKTATISDGCKRVKLDNKVKYLESTQHIVLNIRCLISLAIIN